jgi:molybdopterin converting factor small subunit
MKVRVLAFATAATKLGWRETLAECSPRDSPRTVLAALAPEFDVSGMRVSVDLDYRSWDEPIGRGAKELAVVPPVSGG